MKLVSVVALSSVLMLALASFAGAAPAPKPLKTFGTGDVTASTDTATIVNDSGEYGGVYLQSKSQSGKALNDVDFEFTSRGDVQGGAPRFSLPIDDPATPAKVDGYAFLDAANCGAPVGDNPANDATLVSTQNPACMVYFNGPGYANWDAFAAAHPTYKTSAGEIPFIIADVAGNYSVTGIVLR